jgi:hypothetical protein
MTFRQTLRGHAPERGFSSAGKEPRLLASRSDVGSGSNILSGPPAEKRRLSNFLRATQPASMPNSAPAPCSIIIKPTFYLLNILYYTKKKKKKNE